MTVLPFTLVFLNGAKNLSHLYSLSHDHISSKMSKNLLDCSLRSTSVWSCSRLCGSLSLPRLLLQLTSLESMLSKISLVRRSTSKLRDTCTQILTWNCFFTRSAWNRCWVKVVLPIPPGPSTGRTVRPSRLPLKEVGDLGAQWLHLRHERLDSLGHDGSIEELRINRGAATARQGRGQRATAFTDGVAGVEDGTTDEPVDLVVVGRLMGAFDVVADAVVVDLVEDVVGVLGELAELLQELRQRRVVGDIPALRLVQQALRVE
uniref:Uncharacterized protein n=1 Tax=Oryza punctata TaxID=4537 RepID=A0A0E0M562_ORYPU